MHVQETVLPVLYMENEKNPVDESLYGDKNHLAVRVVLQKYKELYPKESYEILYEKYIKDINENTYISQKQKRERYCWKILKAEEELKNVKTTAKESEEAFPTAVAGSIVLVLGAVAVKLWMKKAEKERR